jgi:hypothetical protein
MAITPNPASGAGDAGRRVGMDGTTVARPEMARPEISPEIREAARAAGGGWLDEVVGTHKPPVPERFIKGAWRLDANGELTGEYVPNPDYGRRKIRCPYAGDRTSG